jgi:hypothetical protein
MRFVAGFVLLVLISGCCSLQNKGVTTTTVNATTTTLATTVEATTTIQTVVQTTTREVTSTTMFRIEGFPEFSEGDFLTFSILQSQAGREFYESSMKVTYKGKSDDKRQDVFEEDYSGQKAGPGVPPELMTSLAKQYYRLEGGKFILDKTVTYPIASASGFTTYSYTPAKVLLDFPLEVGKRWNGSMTVSEKHLNQVVSKLNVNYETSVVGVREITLPNGVMQCLELAHKEDEYLSAQLIQTASSTLYYCPGVKYYAFWAVDVVLPSGKKSDNIRIPEYRTVLTRQELHENGTLVDYKIS